MKFIAVLMMFCLQFTVVCHYLITNYEAIIYILVL